jgi:hypothetical protein
MAKTGNSGGKGYSQLAAIAANSGKIRDRRLVLLTFRHGLRLSEVSRLNLTR